MDKIDGFEHKQEAPKIKEGVAFVFEQCKELSKWGTMEEYSEYLDQIFPESKIKDIVYHTSRSPGIEKFREAHFGIYFAFSPTKSIAGSFLYSVIVCAKNPLIKPKPDASRDEKITYNKEFESFYTPVKIVNDYERIYKYDSSIETSTTTTEGVQLKIRTPEQIHILGNEEDIEKFKEFVEAKKANTQ